MAEAHGSDAADKWGRETASRGGPLRVVVVTPEQTVLDAATEFVALPLFDGELGVAPSHAPMIGRLGFGELRIGREPAVQRFYVDGGFVQVADDVVSVLTNRAIPAAKLDAGSIDEALRPAAASGRRIVKTAPRFSPSLHASTAPPCSSTTCRTIVSPMPSPP